MSVSRILGLSEKSNLREKRVKAVHLLPLFNKSIVLCDTHKCQLVHEIDNIRLPEISVLEVLHSDRKRS